MAFIIPAILENTAAGLDDKMFRATRLVGVERIHVDFCDGQFVGTQTLPIKELDVLNPAFQWEAHLMVEGPKDFLDYQIAGFTTVIIHYEAFSQEALVDEAVAEIKKLGMMPALAIRPETPPSVLRYFGDTISRFLLLSVQPGGQGGAFLEDSAPRLQELRQILPHAILEVDGGISNANAGQLTAAGADALVVGSALFATLPENFEKTYQLLQQATIS